MKKFTYLCLSLFLFSFIWVSNAQKNNQVIVIDAGHGGKDSGKVQEGFSEKDLTLQLSNKLQKAIIEKGYQVVLLRENDKFISLNERIEKINKIKPYLVLSLHANATNNSNKKGFEIFFAENEQLEANLGFASKLSASLVEKTKYKDVSVKNANFKILRESKSPALLLEVGFMTNAQNLTYMKSKEGQQEIINALTSIL